MPLRATKFNNSRSACNGLGLPWLCWLLLLSPVWAQTGKELVVTACRNELRQREPNGSWESQVQRRTAGHIYLEKEIETVDGPVRRLVSVDGHEPPPSDRKQDDDRLRELIQNPRARLAFKKNRKGDQEKFENLIRVFPEAFLFEDQGRHGNVEQFAFYPNPVFKPHNYEETALHAMSGLILVDLEEKRLAQLSGMLTEQVNLGFGLVGHLDRGGTIQLSRIRLSPGVWKTSAYKIDLHGRFILFKTVSKQQEETRTDFKPIVSDLDIEHALQTLVNK